MAEITKEKPVREESRKQQESKEASPYAAKKEQIIEARDRGRCKYNFRKPILDPSPKLLNLIFICS